MAQLALETLSVMPIRDIFTTLGSCLAANGIPLLMSSLLSLCVALSLAELHRRLPSSKSVSGLILIHLLPLFVSPVLLVAIITIYLQELHQERLAQSYTLLACFGYLFHTGIAFVLVNSVFDWDDRGLPDLLYQ
jgi:hypothetical protein